MSKGSRNRTDDLSRYSENFDAIFGKQGKSTWGDGSPDVWGAEDERRKALDAADLEAIVRLKELGIKEENMGRGLTFEDTAHGRRWIYLDDGTTESFIPRKICGNCKHWNEANQPIGFGSCDDPKIATFHEKSDGRIWLTPPADFGCNKFEA